MLQAKVRTLVTRSPAKINLTFEITGLLPDGYHEISTIFQSVSLEDELSFAFEPGSEPGLNIELTCSYVGSPGSIPLDGSNLIARAAQAYLTAVDFKEPLKVRVNVSKQIPVGAGLAGGSANAAATLKAFNFYFDQKLSDGELERLAAKLGADVPFCLSGGTQIGSHKGDELQSFTISEKMTFVLVKPRELQISTPWLYSEFDKKHIHDGKLKNGNALPDASDTIALLVKGEVESALKRFGNVFEPIAFEHHGALADIRDFLTELGSWRTHLSGSGPTIFALVPTLEMARFIRRRVIEEEARGTAPWLEKHGFHLDCFIVESVTAGARVVSQT